MFVSFFIIAVSITLFAYWFRYTCILILSARTTRDYASDVARANQLSFLETRNQLSLSPGSAALERLYDSLDRDYTLLTYMLRNAGSQSAQARSLETWILRIDFRIMSAWYSFTRRFSESRSREALLEMSSIVNHLANSMGEKLALSAT